MFPSRKDSALGIYFSEMIRKGSLDGRSVDTAISGYLQ